MCGIAGCYLFHPEMAGDDWIASCEKAVASIYHRGPDESGSWHDASVYLGMRRLSIIDLAGGSQPIWNEEKSCCIVFNGELYNFLDLRPKLQELGHTFSTRSDTEVVLHAYTEWGTSCLQHLRGMFAFAIWDKREKRLFIARDRIGEKPLYYYRDKDRLLFSSEIKAILADKTVQREIDPKGMANFFAYGHSVAPLTMYRNINKLLPGHYMVVNDHGLRVEEYWDVGNESGICEPSDLSENEWCAKIVELLSDSVRRQMIADVPLGAFLSGGVDSSAVVALMKKHAGGPVKTFSLGFNIGGAYNELADARIVADALKTEHHELNVEHYDLVDTLRTLVYHYDEPYGDAACFPLYLLSRFAREHVKVVLSERRW